MQIKREQLTTTKIKLSIEADKASLERVKTAVLKHLSNNVKVPGFRPGKAPTNLVEKQVDQAVLQSEFLDHAVNDLYVGAIDRERLRPVAQPQITVTKFVPFTTVEFTAEVDVIGDIKLPDYNKIKLTAKKVTADAKEVSEVLDNLRQRAATKNPVTKAAKLGDEAVIDFKGTDAKTGDSIPGADGADYPLVLGSKSFIPGFEEEVVGLKAGDSKTFLITFPSDYGTKDLQSRKVNFEITVKEVNELTQPKLDDAFAASIGPFKSLAELKADVKKQLSADKQREADRAYDNELLEKIASKAVVDIPVAIVDEEIDRIEEEEKRSVVYRGQTWQEHLDAEGISAEEHRERQRTGAELRVKAGLILGEIAHAEKLQVTPEELEIRLMLLKGQYQDPAMLAELEKPESRRDIQNRMMTEKTLDYLRSIATKP